MRKRMPLGEWSFQDAVTAAWAFIKQFSQIEETKSMIRLMDHHRIDFLAKCLEHNGCVNIEQRPNSSTHHPGEISIFTIPSQHVYANTLREAIDAAIKSSLSRTKVTRDEARRP